MLRELAKQGFVILLKKQKEAKISSTDPRAQLEAMMIAYWDFALAEGKFYQLMFGIDFTFSDLKNSLPEAEATTILFMEVIGDILEVDPSIELVQKLYYSFSSILHGLISMHFIRQGMLKRHSELVLKEAIAIMIEMLDSADVQVNNSEMINPAATLTKAFIL